MEFLGDDNRVVGSAGVLPLRLLAEQSGLRAEISAVMTRQGFDPVYDRGQILIDMALTQILGGEAISDFQGLRHLAPVIGPVPSTPTVWRALAQTGPVQLTGLNAALVAFRRHWWGLLAERLEGFPWLKVAGQELTGVTVVDLDASIVFAASEKEKTQPTYKGGIGFFPNLATCDNTDDMLAIDPRPGNATSNCATDNIALLDLAVSRLPEGYCHRMLIRLDEAGFSHDLLEHIADGGGVKGRLLEFSVGWSCTQKEMDAIESLPADAWTPGIDQNGEVIDDTFTADLTDLLDLDGWHNKIPNLRIIVREEPLRPRYHKRATEREKQLRRRYQLIATNTNTNIDTETIAWLDARHRSHVQVENDAKQAKALGLNRWPSQRWTINVAWTQIVALAINLLACFRHLALPTGQLRHAAPKLLRYRLLHLRADWPWANEVINAWHTIKALPAPT